MLQEKVITVGIQKDLLQNHYVEDDLVYMTYLNDVYEGGGTEWMHQKYISVARKGKNNSASDWTHTHRGVVAPKEDKYIITGWFSFEF